MSRPLRRRCIGGYPDCWSFSPDEAQTSECVTLTLDEYETIRLLDREALTQEQCAVKMGIGRTTVTSVYERARKKIAEALVEGKRLRIAGGSYCLESNAGNAVKRKGSHCMRIAIPYENGEIFLHFGRSERFKLYDAENGTVASSQIVDTGENGHGALAGFLKAAGVDALICGGIGMGARDALREAGIRLYAGVTGNADEAAKALTEGTLQYDPDAHCDHHGHHEENCYNHGHKCERHAGK